MRGVIHPRIPYICGMESSVTKEYIKQAKETLTLIVAASEKLKLEANAIGHMTRLGRGDSADSLKLATMLAQMETLMCQAAGIHLALMYLNSPN